MAKVFIGVGHGGSDPGAAANGLVEKTVNLTMALALRDELARHGVTVGISRTADTGGGLQEEIRKANAFAPDLAVEVHNNAGGGKGFEVYCQTNRFQNISESLARNIEAAVKAIGQTSRGLKTRKNDSGKDWFGWLRQVECPAVLCEGAFLDGPDHALIDDAAEQKKFGAAYAKGVLKQLGIAWKAEGSAPAAATGKFKAGDTVTGKGTYYATAQGAGHHGSTAGLTGKVYKTAYPSPYPVNIDRIGWFREQDVTAAKANPYREPAGLVKKGSKGDGVRWVQWALVQKGYSVGSNGVDGDFGKDTDAAVRKFQKDKGLAADGIVGDNTKAKLR